MDEKTQEIMDEMRRRSTRMTELVLSRNEINLRDPELRQACTDFIEYFDSDEVYGYKSRYMKVASDISDGNYIGSPQFMRMYDLMRNRNMISLGFEREDEMLVNLGVLSVGTLLEVLPHSHEDLDEEVLVA